MHTVHSLLGPLYTAAQEQRNTTLGKEGAVEWQEPLYVAAGEQRDGRLMVRNTREMQSMSALLINGWRLEVQ